MAEFQPQHRQKFSIDISTNTFVKFFGVIFGLWFLFLIREVLLVLLIAGAIVVAFDPVADWMQQKLKFHRVLAVSLIYVVFVGIVVLAIMLLIPPLVSQIQELSKNLPSLWEKVAPWFQSVQKSVESSNVIPTSQNVLSGIEKQLSSISNSVFSTTMDVFGGVVSLITIFVISFYLLVGEQNTKKFLISILPIAQREYIVDVIKRIADKVGGWARGQMLLSLSVFVLTLIGLISLRVPYALSLAIIAGITEIIPIIGPWIGGIPAVIVAFTISPWMGIFVLILYIVVQQIENHVLVPNIMKKTVGLSPVVVIIAILIGAKIAGLLGIFLAVPIAASLMVIGQEVFAARESVRATKGIKRHELKQV